VAVKEPWWKGQLENVARELRSYLARRLPSRREQFDDLVNETLLSLSEWMRRHEGTPHPWIAGPATEDDRRSFFAFARVILHRRIADRFRLDAREWGRRVDLDEAALASIPSGAPSAERQFLLRRMLEITIGALSTLKAEDRDLN
jgi:DNA-directed RNA polymerase specialized sigma24 family protein